MNEPLSILDFGADPTGKQDSAPAFAVAFAAAKDFSFPLGATFLIASKLRLPSEDNHVAP